MLKPLIRLTGSDRKVWFMSEDGQTISAIKNNNKTYVISQQEQVEDTNTWRPIQVEDTDVLTDSTTKINFKAGSNVTLTYENGTITISASDMDTTYQVAVASVSGEGGSVGLMSAMDKERLDNLPGESSIVTNSDVAVSLTLASNTIYYCTNESITSLTISGVAEGFKYAALIFRSPSTATTFAMPEDGGTPSTNYYCVGPPCIDGTFTPEASKRYSMAIEQEFDRITIYVVEAV